MLRHNLGVSVLLCLSYGTIFILGILGNGFVVIAISRKRLKKTTANILIGNLAVADLLVTIFCVPFTLTSNLFIDWPFGKPMCKFVAYIEAVSVNASVNSLVALSLERCWTISSPLRSILVTRKILIWFLLIWMNPVVLMLVWLVVFDLKPLTHGSNLMICTDTWINKLVSDTYFILVNFTFSYLLPLILIFLCYMIILKKITSRNVPGEISESRSNILFYKPKLNIIKMLLVIIITFALLWLPLYILFFITKFLNYPNTDAEIKLFHVLFPVAQCLGALNSCINPIIYTFFSRYFRCELQWLFQKNTTLHSNLPVTFSSS